MKHFKKINKLSPMIRDGKIFNYRNFIILFLFVTTFLVRISYVSEKSLTFGFDQGRDAFIIQEIIDGDVKILGPSVSGVPGLSHGVLYYYFMLPPYFVDGSPITAAYYLAFINSLTIFVIYILMYFLTKKQTAAFIAMLLFTVSFEASQYATWLSNPAMGIWFVTLLYLGIYLWIKQKSLLAPLITGVSFGLSIQSNISLTYHLFAIIFLLFLNRDKITLKSILLFSASFILSISTIIAAAVIFGKESSFTYLLEGKEQYIIENMGKIFINYGKQMSEIINNNFTTDAGYYSLLNGLGLVVIVLFDIIKRNKYNFEKGFLLVWFLSYSPGALISTKYIPHTTVGIGIGLILLVSVYLYQIYLKNRFLGIAFISFIVISNLSQISQHNKQGQTIFAIQKDMILKNQLAIIDYTYNNSNGKEFCVNTLTSPLFINTTWSYLYNWYGKETYGYLPYWCGRDQINTLGNNLITYSKNNFISEIDHYYIVEDMNGIPERYLEYGLGEENARSKFIDEIHFGELLVQHRILDNY